MLKDWRHLHEIVVFNVFGRQLCDVREVAFEILVDVLLNVPASRRQNQDIYVCVPRGRTRKRLLSGKCFFSSAHRSIFLHRPNNLYLL